MNEQVECTKTQISSDMESFIMHNSAPDTKLTLHANPLVSTNSEESSVLKRPRRNTTVYSYTYRENHEGLVNGGRIVLPIPVHSIVDVYERTLNHVENLKGQCTYDKYSIQELVMFVVLNDRMAFLDSRDPINDIVNYCINKILDDKTEKYMSQSKRDNLEWRDPKEHNIAISRYNDLMDSESEKNKRRYRKEEIERNQQIWTKTMLKKFRIAFQKFGYAASANRKIAEYLGSNVLPNHVSFLKAMLRRKFNKMSIDEIVKSNDFKDFVNALPANPASKANLEIYPKEKLQQIPGKETKSKGTKQPLDQNSVRTIDETASYLPQTSSPSSETQPYESPREVKQGIISDQMFIRLKKSSIVDTLNPEPDSITLSRESTTGYSFPYDPQFNSSNDLYFTPPPQTSDQNSIKSSNSMYERHNKEYTDDEYSSNSSHGSRVPLKLDQLIPNNGSIQNSRPQEAIGVPTGYDPIPNDLGQDGNIKHNIQVHRNQTIHQNVKNIEKFQSGSQSQGFRDLDYSTNFYMNDPNLMTPQYMEYRQNFIPDKNSTFHQPSKKRMDFTPSQERIPAPFYGDELYEDHKSYMGAPQPKIHPSLKYESEFPSYPERMTYESQMLQQYPSMPPRGFNTYHRPMNYSKPGSYDGKDPTPMFHIKPTYNYHNMPQNHGEPKYGNSHDKRRYHVPYTQQPMGYPSNQSNLNSYNSFSRDSQMSQSSLPMPGPFYH